MVGFCDLGTTKGTKSTKNVECNLMFGSAAEVSMGLLVNWDTKFEQEAICKRSI